MKAILNRLSHLFSLEKLTPGFRRFSLMHCLFLVFISVQGFFMNTLLIRITGDNTIVSIYNMGTWIVSAIFMIVAVFVIKKTSLKFTFPFSILMFILLNIFFLMFMNELDKYLYVIVFFNAAGGGFYWIGFSIAINDYNQGGSKPVALAWVGAIATAVNVLMPALAGFGISAFDGIKGYYVVFGLSLVFAVMTVITALTLPKTKQKNKETYFKKALKGCFKNKILSYVMLGEFSRAIREGAFMFLLNILLFNLVTNESVVGINTFLCSAITFFAQWSSARIITRYKYSKIMNFSIVSLTVATSMIIFNYSPLTIILLSIINGFFSVYIYNPTLTIFYNGVMAADSDNKISFEIYSLRECLIALGRSLGLIVVFIMPKTPLGYAMAMIILTLSQFFTSFFMTRADKLMSLEADL